VILNVFVENSRREGCYYYCFWCTGLFCIAHSAFYIVERGLVELRKLSIEPQLWEASRKGIDQPQGSADGNHKPATDSDASSWLSRPLSFLIDSLSYMYIFCFVFYTSFSFCKHLNIIFGNTKKARIFTLHQKQWVVVICNLHKTENFPILLNLIVIWDSEFVFLLSNEEAGELQPLFLYFLFCLILYFVLFSYELKAWNGLS